MPSGAAQNSVTTSKLGAAATPMGPEPWGPMIWLKYAGGGSTNGAIELPAALATGLLIAVTVAEEFWEGLTA